MTNNPMVIILAKGGNQQPSINILLRLVAYDAVQKWTVLPLWEMKRETMMILKKKKVNLANKDVNTSRNHNSTSVIYFTAVKVSQCRQVAANRK